MPIRISLEHLEKSDIKLYKNDLPSGDRFVMPHFEDDEQHILLVESPEDDLGGRLSVRPGEVDSVLGRPKEETDQQLGEVPNGTKVEYTELLVGGRLTHEILTQDGVRIKLVAQHIGPLALICHPNTARPLMEEEPDCKDDDWWSLYDPFTIATD